MGDDEYFASYGDLATHELMLKDAPRMNAYAAAVQANADYIRGRAVLDVGAGTGILSLLCARAGARAVFAVEASPMAKHLRDVVARNNYADVITVFESAMEDTTLPEQVDVCISEWMGFHLLHESMLDSVLLARSKWLRPGGRMLPSKARIFAAPVAMEAFCQEKFGFFESVLGFDMANLAALSAQQVLSQPLITDLVPEQLLAAPAEVALIDCETATADELQEALGGGLGFACTRSGVCHGYAIWFECEFPRSDPTTPPVKLSTAPGEPRTHWQQTVVFLPEMLQATAGQTRLDCSLMLVKDSEQPRMCSIELEI